MRDVTFCKDISFLKVYKYIKIKEASHVKKLTYTELRSNYPKPNLERRISNSDEHVPEVVLGEL